jgi:hypothetical protein
MEDRGSGIPEAEKHRRYAMFMWPSRREHHHTSEITAMLKSILHGSSV